MDKVYRVHEETKFGNFKWIGSKYYDYPDGQDLIGKLSYTTKMVLIPSAICGHIYGSVIPPVATTDKARLFKLLRCMIPGVGSAVAFTCVTYFATNIRKKDDPWNYLLGGVAAGATLGLTSGNSTLGVLGIVLFGFFATAQKIAKLNNEDLFPPIKPRGFSSYYLREWDFSLIPDTRRGEWTRDPPPENK